MKRNIIYIFLLGIIVIFLFLFSCVASIGTTTLLSEDFQSYTPTKSWKPTNGWSSQSHYGSWAIAEVEGNRLLQYFEDGKGKNRLLKGQNSWTDMTVSFRVKLNGTSYAGISRVKTGGDTYDVFITNNSNIAFIRRADPMDTTLATARFLVKPDTFYNMKVVFSGGKVKVFMDNNSTPIISVDAAVAENGHKPGGKVGFFVSSSDSKGIAIFDDLVVTKP